MVIGMADNEEEDSFFNDDFPDIPDDELRELEQHAITSTQQARNASIPREINSQRHAPIPTRAQRTGVSAQLRKPPTKVPLHLQPHHPGLNHAESNSFDSTILDEDGLPVGMEENNPQAVVQRQPDETTLREQWRVNRFGRPSIPSVQRPYIPQRPVNDQALMSHSQAYPGVPRTNTQAQQPVYAAPNSNLLNEDRLGRVAELEAQLRLASEELQTRRGEIATIRSRHAEDEKIRQREINAINKLKQEEAEKYRAALQAIESEKIKIVSELQFKKQELSEEARKVQTLQRQLKERPLRDKPSNVQTTPKRNVNSLRDGFEDDDLMMISPAKSGGRRSKPGTPTANRKRKQPTGNDLNVPPLVLRPSASTSRVEHEAGSLDVQDKQAAIAPVIQKDRATARHLRLIQQVLTFRSGDSRAVLTEKLIEYAFPSDRTTTFSTLVMMETGKLKGERLAGDLLQIFINLWIRARKEKYHACISLLIEVISFILETDVFVLDADIVRGLLPLIVSTAEINAQTRFHLLVKKDWLDNSEKKKPEYDKDLNPHACLDLLLTIASLVADEPDLIILFWRTLDTDFILMMLMACQPIKDTTIMLHLLGTSILNNTFGSICSEEEQQRMEAYIIDRVCFLFWETPKIHENEDHISEAALCRYRLEALDFFAKLTMATSPNPYRPALATNHGTTFLANHPNAVARLSRFIYDETAAMYLLTPAQLLHAELVNRGIHILHFILNSPAGRELDLQRALKGAPGASQKYRVVLSRLAYSEGISIDRGITMDTVRMATELLEDCVTPDESEDWSAVFEGGSTRAQGGFGSTQSTR